MSQTFTVLSLKQHDGSGPTGSIYVAINGIVYDVKDKGKEFYGKGGPYQMFAGHDASRALATMNMSVKDGQDDLSDLNQMEKDNLAKWDLQFKGKYPLVGKLVG